MTITETCRCGATITLSGWDAQSVDNMAMNWRRTHICQGLRLVPSKVQDTEEGG